MIIRIGMFAGAIMAALVSQVHAEKAATFFADYGNYNAKGKALLDKIEPTTGKVELANGVNLDLKDRFYFLNAEDAREILVEAWGNPPDSVTSTSGMIFPGKNSPLADTWGVEIRPDMIGYVEDTDAATINYDELLQSMKADTQAGNEERTKAGYDPITLIGWAAQPTYDAANKRLHWAKELQFGDKPQRTLNYDIRFLNRQGVLVMSYIATMEQLPQVNQSLPDVLNTVSFDEGTRYADFVPGTDQVAAVGIGGLIAGKVLAKTGFLVVALAMLKKFGFLLLLPLIWVWRKMRGTA